MDTSLVKSFLLSAGIPENAIGLVLPKFEEDSKCFGEKPLSEIFDQEPLTEHFTSLKSLPNGKQKFWTMFTETADAAGECVDVASRGGQTQIAVEWQQFREQLKVFESAQGTDTTAMANKRQFLETQPVSHLWAKILRQHLSEIYIQAWENKCHIVESGDRNHVTIIRDKNMRMVEESYRMR